MTSTTRRAPREASSTKATTTLYISIILAVPVGLFVHRQHAARNTPDMLLLAGQRDHAGLRVATCQVCCVLRAGGVRTDLQELQELC